MSDLPAVVMPSDRPASLGIARSLGRRGIPVYGIDVDPRAIGLVSRYLHPCPLPNADDSDENRLQYLVDLGRKLGRAVLYPVSDDEVILCSRERDELERYYLYVMPDHATVESLVSKDGLYGVARRCGVQVPQMFQPQSDAEWEALSERLTYPVILKPAYSTSWLRPEIIDRLRDSALSSPPKVALCGSSDEFLDTYRWLAQYDPRIIVQEVVGGEDERLAYFCFYLDRQSRPLGVFAGRKLRVLPVGFGSATYVRSFRDEDLERVSLQLLSGSKYQGLGGVEFKKDPRDEQYKLIEFNARFGMWDALSIRCGIDLPYMAYCDAQGLPVKPQQEYREGVMWVDLQRDVRAFILYRRRRRLSLVDWLRSLQGEKDWAVYAPDDWKPALISTAKLLERPWSGIRKAISIRRTGTATSA